MTTCPNCGHTPKPSAAARILDRAGKRLNKFKSERRAIADEPVHFWVLAYLCAVEELDELSESGQRTP